MSKKMIVPMDAMVASRRKYYMDQVKVAFNALYDIGDIAKLGKFEKSILQLTDSALKGALESLVEKEKPAERPQAKAPTKADERPLMTLEVYSKCRDEGMTNEQIKEKYRTSSKYQICGFARHYSRKKSQSQA